MAQRQPAPRRRQGTSRTPVARPAAGSQTRTRPGAVSRPGARGGARIPLAAPPQRLRWLVVVLLMLITLFMGRAIQLQALDSTSYASAAASQMTTSRNIAPQRGTITDRFGTVMAASVPAVKIIADPVMIARNGYAPGATMDATQQAIAAQTPKALADILAKYLGGTADTYLPALTTQTDKSGKQLHYVVVAAQVDTSVWNQIAKQMAAGGPVPGLKRKAPYWFGLTKQDNPRRIYPSGSVAGNLVGTMGHDADGNVVGITGLESYLNEYLTGTAGKETYESSAYGRIPLGTDTLIPAVNGYSYTTTVDATLQQAAESALASGVVKAAGSTGTAIVMNVKTGEVLADANLPGYDPAKVSATAAKNDLLNRSVESIYEPGSVEKVLTMAALADKGLVTADTHVQVASRLKSGDGYINDDWSHGTIYLTARGVLANSSNIGTAELARQMDKNALLDSLKRFGLGEQTQVQLPNESAGLLPKTPMQDYTRDQIAFGQGLSVNALQMASAVAGIVNDGVYNPPTLLKSATDGNGKPVSLPAKQARRIISSQASAQVRDMMEAVIRLHATSRAIPGYRTIGKSGTAERPDATGGGYSGFTSSFVLAAPAEDPQILVYIVIDQPEVDAHQGSQVALPVANEIMKLALPRYGVAPSTTKPLDEPDTYKP